MKISRATILEAALRRPFRTNAAVRRMVLDGLRMGGAEGAAKVVEAFKLGHAADETAWSYILDSTPREIVAAAQKVADRT